ncbi:MAG: hypothetical protein M1438_07495, partial [Deltaproteobacteria bacterium]|nr:hypothetical protein [Deltaproteobacteria bacterium]
MDHIYQFLNAIGYHNLFHPPLTRMPTGLVAGALVFVIWGCRYGRPDLTKASRYLLILALVFSIPAILSGIMDWQHNYRGIWTLAIQIKIGLSILLLVLLSLGIHLTRKAEVCTKGILLIYVFYFVIVV